MVLNAEMVLETKEVFLMSCNCLGDPVAAAVEA